MPKKQKANKQTNKQTYILGSKEENTTVLLLHLAHFKKGEKINKTLNQPVIWSTLSTFAIDLTQLSSTVGSSAVGCGFCTRSHRLGHGKLMYARQDWNYSRLSTLYNSNSYINTEYCKRL
jgi:hypothetical protein